MATLESRIASLETQDATAINRVILYEPGEPMPEIPPGDGPFILLPNNGRENTPHGNP